MNILEAHAIGKRYAGAGEWAVRDFAASIASGELVALLGESGCGKTTVLRMISGFEVPDSGELRLNGKRVSGPACFIEPEKRGVGIVFQDYGLFPHKNVQQNIRFGLFRWSEREARARVQDVLELNGLQGLERRYPHQLSGGQQQRVAIARAIAPNPSILLFDEPFSNIDSKRRELLRSEIRSLVKQTGITSIFVTHDTRDVLAVADRVFVLREGRPLQIGSPAEVYRRPRNSYIAEFFGKTNLLAADTLPHGYRLPFGEIPAARSGRQYGRRVTLSIRPDAFEIAGPGTPEAFPATLLDRQFCGEYQELTCQPDCSCNATRLAIYAPAHQQFVESTLHLTIRAAEVNELEG